MLRFLKQLDLNCTLRFSFTDTMFNISSTRCLPKGQLTPSEAQVGVQISWQPHRCSQQCNTNAKFRTTSCKRSASQSQRNLISIQQVLLSCIADSRAHCLPVELSGCNQNGLNKRSQSIVNDWPSAWSTAGQIASLLQADGIKQTLQMSLHSTVVVGNGSKTRVPRV